MEQWSRGDRLPVGRSERVRSDLARLRDGIDAGLVDNSVAIALHLTNGTGLAAVHSLLSVRLLLLHGRQCLLSVGVQLKCNYYYHYHYHEEEDEEKSRREGKKGVLLICIQRGYHF